MEFVEINANRKPKLSGGRRGSSTLLPGGTQVSNNLVPVSQLPASAGALGNTFKDIYNERIARDPSNPTGVRAIVMRKGGKMSKSIPQHGHGANTQIGTNYKLSQFGGSMAEPIGNTASTLSPALSIGSVGAGRKKASKKGGRVFDNLMKTHKGAYMLPYKQQPPPRSRMPTQEELRNGWDALPPDALPPNITGAGRKLPLPKGKHLLKLVKYIAKTKANLHGMKSGAGWLQSGMKFLGKVGKDLLDKHGEAILDKGKELLIEQLKKKANEYIGAGIMEGGSFLDTIGKALHILINPNVVEDLGKELLSGGGWFNKFIEVVKRVGHDVAKPFEIVGVNPWDLGYGLGHDVIGPALKKAIKGGKMEEGERKIGGAAKKPSARGAIVSRIMKEKHLSLPMASKYVKEHGLY